MAPVSMLLADTFCLSGRNTRSAWRVSLGVAIGITYWAMAALLEAMGGVGTATAIACGWSPDIIFFFLGLYFFFKMPT